MTMQFQRRESKFLRDKTTKIESRNMMKFPKCYKEMSRIWCAWVMIVAINAFGTVTCCNDELLKQGMVLKMYF